MQILDKFEYSNDIKSGQIDFDSVKDKLENEIANSISTGKYEKKIQNLRNIISKSLSDAAKYEVYKTTVKNIFLSKLSSIKNISDLETLGIVNGVFGLDFSGSKLLENSNEIDLVLSYKFKLDKFGIFSIEKDINQKILVSAWANNVYKEDFSSIWEQSNFERGRFFADYFRKNSSDIVVKLGGGIDLYNQESNTISQIYSINVFDKTYSNYTGEKYELTDAFIDLVKKYSKELDKNILDSKGKIETSDGSMIEIGQVNKKLILILPEEARTLSNIEMLLANNDWGNIVEIIYKEKAINDI